MKNLFLITVFIFVSQFGVAQVSNSMHQSTQQIAENRTIITGNYGGLVDFSSATNTEILSDLVAENDKIGRVITIGDNKYQITNTIYLFDSNEGFTNIYTDDGKGFKVPNANYNLNSQQLEVPLKNNQVFVFDLSNVTFFEKNNKKYVRKTNGANIIMCEVLIEKDVNNILYKGFEVVTKDAMTNPLTNEITKPAYNVKENKYFIQFDAKLVEVDQSTRNFLKSLSAHSDSVKDFMKKNDLKLSEEDDLKKIANYLFSIIN